MSFVFLEGQKATLTPSENSVSNLTNSGQEMSKNFSKNAPKQDAMIIVAMPMIILVLV